MLSIVEGMTEHEMRNSDNWPKCHIEWIDPADVERDEYQRPVDHARARRMARDFDEDKFLMPVVGRRDNGRIYAIDGSHRLCAATVAKCTRVPVLMLDGTKREHEAWMFRQQNDRYAVPTGSRFNARCIEGDDDAIVCRRVCDEFGISIAKDTHCGESVTSCAVTLMGIIEQCGEDGLRQCLSLLTDTFGRSAAAMRMPPIFACYLLIMAYPEMSRGRMVDRCAEVGVAEITRQAHAKQQFGAAVGNSLTLSRSFADCMVAIYNKGLYASKRLDPGAMTHVKTPRHRRF